MTAHVWPTATYRKIPAADRQPKITPRAVILHSAGGRGSLYQWWLTNPRGLESHLWIAENGTTEQYVPFNIRADANGQANSFAISIETESTKYATEPWTQAQVDRLIAVLDWVCRTYSIPRRLMTHPTDSGIAWHIQFGAPGPWTGVAKSCPGPARIEQVKSVIVPRLQALTGAKPAPSPSKPSTPGGLTMSDITTILNRLDRLERLGARKAIAVRDPRDKKVWIVCPDGRRRHLPNPGNRTVDLLVFLGVLQPGGDGHVHPISGEHLDLIPTA